MAAFHIRQVDPVLYRERIIELWHELLPGTPPQRFDWLMNGNPAGEALWFFAFDNRSGDPAGVMSLVPRTMFVAGRRLRAGILGDFMVARPYRAFGPGLALPRHVVNQSRRLGFDLLYTVPNPSSRKILQSAGLSDETSMRTLMKPVSTKPYLERYVPKGIAALVAPFANACIRAVSADSYHPGTATITEDEPISAAFDALWQNVRATSRHLIGDRCSEYLRWKHGRNPLGAMQALTLRTSHGQGEIEGYVFYRILSGSLQIHDLLLLDERKALPLLRKAWEIARRSGCRAVYVRLGVDCSVVRYFGRSLFINVADDTSVLRLGRSEFEQVPWHLLDGDRNV